MNSILAKVVVVVIFTENEVKCEIVYSRGQTTARDGLQKLLWNFFPSLHITKYSRLPNRRIVPNKCTYRVVRQWWIVYLPETCRKPAKNQNKNVFGRFPAGFRQVSGNPSLTDHTVDFFFASRKLFYFVNFLYQKPTIWIFF